MDLNTARDLRTVYLHTFDAFATDPVTVADLPSIGNARYARELLALLVSNGLVVQDNVNGGEDVWQAATTYDEISRAEAESVIDTWLSTQGVDPAPAPATPKAATKKASKPASNPADLPLCACGCLSPGKSTYRPGHDARHAGQVARDIADSGNFALLAELPSQPLQDKAAAMAERLIEKAAAKEQRESMPKITVKEANAEVAAAVEASKEEPAPAKRKTSKKSRLEKNMERQDAVAN